MKYEWWFKNKKEEESKEKENIFDARFDMTEE